MGLVAVTSAETIVENNDKLNIFSLVNNNFMPWLQVKYNYFEIILFHTKPRATALIK